MEVPVFHPDRTSRQLPTSAFIGELGPTELTNVNRGEEALLQTVIEGFYNVGVSVDTLRNKIPKVLVAARVTRLAEVRRSR